MTIQHSRKEHLKSLWAERPWGKWVGLAWFVLSALLIVRDEFWRPDLSSSWKLISLVPNWSLATWVTITLVLLLVGVYEASYRASTKDKTSLSAYETPTPIEISFDPTNRQGRFWSVESVLKPDNTISHQFYRYSIAIKNTGGLTLRDVEVVSEMTGELSNRPTAGEFDITKEPKTDLNPGDQRFVTVFVWPYPAIQPGMLADASAKWGYGSVKISVSATDTRVTVRTFDFDFEKEPMLFDPLPAGTGDLPSPPAQLTRSKP